MEAAFEFIKKSDLIQEKDITIETNLRVAHFSVIIYHSDSFSLIFEKSSTGIFSEM